jgi:hypothetical protein
MAPISESVFESLIAAGRSLDERPKSPDRFKDWGKERKAPAGEPGGRPGEQYDARGLDGWADLLGPLGWKRDHAHGDTVYLTRPGKDKGVSASLGHCRSGRGDPRLFVFTSNAHPFEPDTSYSQFAAYALLNHGGDLSAAAGDLASQGYGEPPAPVGGRPTIPPTMQPAAPAPGAEPRPDGRPFLWASELRKREKSDKWLWEGYLNRGGVTLLTALWKAGKSTLLAHLVKAFGDGSAEFCGLPIKPAKVLYVTEEDETIWAERRDELSFSDHVGFWPRPFKGRSNKLQWEAHVNQTVDLVRTYGFNLVVIDTISKLWPVRDENDAGQVEEALMPLWRITETGAGILVVHHTRKSGGEEFTAGRGSGGLPAFAETLIELRRHNPKDRKDRKRRLTGGGRYGETKLEWLIELTDTGYVGLGEYEEADPEPTRQDWRDLVPAVLGEATRHGMTVDEVEARLRDRGAKFRNGDLVQELKRQSKDEGGALAAVGRGAKGDPVRYALRIPSPTPHLGECAGTEFGDGIREGTAVQELE